MKSLSLVLFAAFAGVAFGAPEALVTEIESEGVSPEWIKVSYTLSGDAVVTTEFYSDGVKIPDAKVTRLFGDVNRRVSATASGQVRSFRWAAGAELGSDRETVRQGAQLSVKLTVWPLENPPLYMAVSLQATNVVRYYATEASVPGGVTNVRWKTGWMLLRHIHARNVPWMMGSPTDESGRGADETLHPVLLTKDYYIGIYPVTQRQSQAATGVRTNYASGFEQDADCDFYPENVWPYSSVMDYFLPKFQALTKLDLDLPSEAEWEFACRAGTTTPYNFGTASDISGKMWYGNANQKTTTVDRFPANAWGLYGMHGGIREFCRDRYADYPTTGKTAVDPVGSLTEGSVIVRGGSYASIAPACRSAARATTDASTASWDYGFRLMAPAVAK